MSFIQQLPLPIAIVGMGLTGKATLRLLLAAGLAQDHILTYDSKDSAAQFKNSDELLKNGKPKTLIVSPGVPLSSPWIQGFKRSGGRITSELEIAFSFLTTEKLICVTGSIGKSTTTALLGAGVESFSKNSFIGGNLGFPLADYVADILLGLSKERADWVVLELSSYQLENFMNLKCDLAVITYFTPNHMERYSSLNQYYETKLLLLSKAKTSIVLNKSGGDLFSYINSHPNFLPKIKINWTDRDSSVVEKSNLSSCALVGKYNIDNLAMAATVAQEAGWPDISIQAMKEFKGLPHRLENVGIIKGVQFINDSKATTIDSVIEAIQTVLPELESRNSKGSLFSLMGGHDKNLPWEKLKKLSKHSQLRPIFFGEFGAQAKKITQLEGPVYETLAKALKELPKLIQKNDIVLLSPGGTSHDEFKNFEERGSFFKSEILKY